MNWGGIIIGVFLVAGIVVWFFTDWQDSRDPTHLTNEEQMEALGRVVEIARRMNK